MPPTGVRIHATAGVQAIRRYLIEDGKMDRKAVLPVTYWQKGCSGDSPLPEETD